MRLSRWKIFDNLRRSLVPPLLVSAVSVGWLALPAPPGSRNVCGDRALAFPFLFHGLAVAITWPSGVLAAAAPRHARTVAVR